MTKTQKGQAEDVIRLLGRVHDGIKKAIERGQQKQAMELLSQCQQSAIDLGETIEETEGEGFVTVSYLEHYCEVVYQAYALLGQVRDVYGSRVYKNLKRALIQVENSVKNDIKARLEIVFFPYKVSMWDSLESVYLAAKADQDCDVYCVPIPYYDITPEHTFGQMHYEGGEYPENIEITDWESYHLEERRPDVIYIHNPYDNWNLVTSVHPRYYSENLKKYTKTLVYIPYYSTSGGMSEGQRLCPAYVYADYIVIQSPKLRPYFDERIPDEKFLPFGSPKFDKVLGKCQNPPAPPAGWKQKMEGKRVYFYNTSLNGMLADTESFLKKMRYVFSCFQGRRDACLLWRPHPLLESTFDSMRPEHKKEFLELKQYFSDHDLGIYDGTPDMTDAIALSDAYIGDSGTSVTSLFGLAGKPLFILNNRLHSEPEEDSWRGEINIGWNYPQQNRFAIVQGNRLYVSKPFAYDYHYLCDLSEQVYGGDYNVVWEIGGKLYVCPQNAQDILVIDENGGKRKVELEKVPFKRNLFYWTVRWEEYLILRPINYPALVSYNTVTEEVKYFKEYIDVFIKEIDGMLITGGWRLNNGKFYSFSPIDRQVYVLDVKKGKSNVVKIPAKSICGCVMAAEYGNDFWLLPYKGDCLSILCWNPKSNEIKEFDKFPEGFQCINSLNKSECMEWPFTNCAMYGNYLYLTPNYANMCVRLNTVTGEMIEWIPPFNDKKKEEYFFTRGKSTFLCGVPDERKMVTVYSYAGRKLFKINPETNKCSEWKIQFDLDELKTHEPGFCRYSEYLKYCCQENAFNSLKDFLDGTIIGSSFDKDQQIECYQEISSNHDGTCGIKVHEFIRKL